MENYQSHDSRFVGILERSITNEFGKQEWDMPAFTSVALKVVENVLTHKMGLHDAYDKEDLGVDDPTHRAIINAAINLISFYSSNS